MTHWLHKMKQKRICIPLAVIFCFLIYSVSINAYSLIEGIEYLLDGLMYEPIAKHPVRKDGPFGLTHELVSLSSQERMESIKRVLVEEGIQFDTIAVMDGCENIFVPGNVSDSFILIEAHYDKERDDPSFHAATDNTGSVVVLLAVIRQLKGKLSQRQVGFLFTPFEERGLLGAHHFIDYAQQKGYHIEGVLCLDMLGRGNPGLATPANAAGFRFRIPFYGPMLFNGRELRKAPASWTINKSIANTYLPNVNTYKAFLSYTDTNAFLEAGIPAVHLGGDNMWHADQVWGRYTDTIDRLDEHDLLKCKTLIEDVIKKL